MVLKLHRVNKEDSNFNRGWDDGCEAVQAQVDKIVKSLVDNIVDHKTACDMYKGGYLNGVASELVRTAMVVFDCGMKGQTAPAMAAMVSSLNVVFGEIVRSEAKDGK